MGSRRMPGGFQGLNVCQRGGELLSRFCEVGTVEAGGNESHGEAWVCRTGKSDISYLKQALQPHHSSLSGGELLFLLKLKIE